MPKRRTVRRRKAAARTVQPPLARLKDTWTATRAALATAEQRMERQVRSLLKRNQLATRDAAVILNGLRARAERERRKAVSGLESSLQTLQTRVERERKAFGRSAREAVQSTLAALNIPSRQEITELTRRVERLSRKLDSRKR
jgi:hypothetical protein